VQIEPVDPRDETAFAEWFGVAAAVEQHERPGEPGWTLHEQRESSVAGLQPDADTRKVLLVAREAAEAVGIARLGLPQRDNLHSAEVLLMVHPDARRRGIGRALDREVERRAAEAGRTTLIGHADEPPGWEGESPGRLGALALGWQVVQTEVRRDIDLPLDAERVAELERTCRPRASGYEIRTWWDRCPDDLVDDRAELARQMSTDVPLDGLDWREEVWDADRIRRGEAVTAAMGRTVVAAGAVHLPTGRMVAFTDIGIGRADPRRAFQWETLVSGPHRGRRLGTLLKVAALHELSRGSPQTQFLTCWNARENAPMIAVNDTLGARVNGQLAILQRSLG
jgi:GNAT superfamily N-acetyltransferase